MAIDFEALDKKVDFSALNKDIEDAKGNAGTGEFPELPAGYYFVHMEKLELGETKDGRPMVRWQFRVADVANRDDLNGVGVKFDNAEAVEFMDNYKPKKKPCMFMNRVIYGNRVTDKWNDGVAIQGVVTWLSKLECDFDVTFHSYSQFADLLLDIAEDMEGVDILVQYDPDAFYSVNVISVYE